jgi:hypothetical protein
VAGAVGASRVFPSIVFDRHGKFTLRVNADLGITAITRLNASHVLVGFKDGTLQFVSAHSPSPTTARMPASSARARRFSQTPANATTQLLRGPQGTVIAGFADGTVGMWNTADGNRLQHARIHGPITQMLIEDRKLYAISELGQQLVWDLTSLYTEYCTLLDAVWSRVPVVWQDGQAVLRKPPVDHPCQRARPRESTRRPAANDDRHQGR